MKTTFRYIVAALAAGMALVSCSKENIIKDENVIPEVKGGRVITVSFGETMKSTLAEGSSTQPVFVNGDEIFITNGDDNEKSTVEVKTDPKTQMQVAIIRTSLPGALTAVYPYDAAIAESIVKQDGECPTVNITLKNQNGSFATANISKAEINAAENMMTFKNQTALLKVTLPEGTTKLTVKSLSDENITEDGKDGKNLTIESIVSQTGISYVAILPGVKLSDLSFDAAVDETSGSLKGIPAKTFATGDPNRNVTTLNSIYKIGASNWHPYVVVNGKKWATMNIGAESETDPGEYFMWAEVVGHKYIDGKWTNFPETKPADTRYSVNWDSSKCFADCNTPYFVSTSGTKYSKYTDANKGITLLAEDDAANYNWGGTWRMPTQKEIEDLGIRDSHDATVSTKKVKMSDDGKYLVVIGTGLKFNVTGQVNGNNAPSTTYPTLTSGAYWTSTGNTGNNQLKYFYFNTDPQIRFGGRNRNYGLAIRPVSD